MKSEADPFPSWSINIDTRAVAEWGRTKNSGAGAWHSFVDARIEKSQLPTEAETIVIGRLSRIVNASNREGNSADRQIEVGEFATQPAGFETSAGDFERKRLGPAESDVVPRDDADNVGTVWNQ